MEHGAMIVYLETPRLILRQFTMDDVDDLMRLDTDPQVMRYIHAALPTRDDIINTTLPRLLACHAQHPEFGYFATIERASVHFIGWLHFRPAPENRVLFRSGIDREDEIELGYRLARSAWGRGYATEASRALVIKGFRDLNVARVTASAMVANRASTRVMEKAGLKLVEQYFHEGLQLDMVKYALDRAEFEAREFVSQWDEERLHLQ
jgi:RimJ/RimL family protein N-acetyltransferase